MAEIDNKILNGVSNRPLNILRKSFKNGNEEKREGYKKGKRVMEG